MTGGRELHNGDADAEAVLDRAATLAGRAETAGHLQDPEAVNVVVDGATAVPATGGGDVDARPVEGGYEGDDAGPVGRLAATLAALEQQAEGAATLHYPEPIGTARGPWLVVAPLAGRLATVARGRGTLTLSAAADDVSGAGDDGDDCLQSILDRVDAAATPTHEHYPVADDDLGVFVRGLTAVERRGVEERRAGPGTHALTLDVLTTPATTRRAVEDRFSAVDGVSNAGFEFVAGVERATPSDTLREAAEAAAVAVVGDAEYEWLAEPGTFSFLPSANKVALGAGRPGTGSVHKEDLAATRDLVAGTVERLGGSR